MKKISLIVLHLLIQVNSQAERTSLDTVSGCPDGQVLDLNGKCVKKFVLPKKKSCPEPNIRFGYFEFSLGGRMAEFWCEDGWSLAPAVPGISHAMCKMVLGQWDRPLPDCVRPGCEPPTVPEHAHVTFELNGAIARFHCLAPYEVTGHPVLGCDGHRWNASQPLCSLSDSGSLWQPAITSDPVNAATSWNSAALVWMATSTLVLMA